MNEVPRVNTSLETLEDFFKNSMIWRDIKAHLSFTLEKERLGFETGLTYEGYTEQCGRVAMLRTLLDLEQSVLLFKKEQVENDKQERENE